jgi:hypothetical protein
MKLNMAIGNKVIDSIAITPSKLGNREYIAGLRNQLEERNREMLEKQIYQAVFFIESVPSRLNKFK